jgi:hypothetical protein
VTSVVVLSQDVISGRAGTVPQSVHVFNEETVGTSGEGGIAFQALAYIQETLRYDDATIATGDPAVCSVRNAAIYGLRVRENLQLMAIDAMRYTANAGIAFDIAPELWCHPNFRSAIWCDPYDVLVPSDQRAWVKYEQLAAYLKIPLDPAAMEQSAELQAQFAEQIAYTGNLY